ncbi:MAG: hypothetical protein OEV42_06755 [Deltaproteobacteria bacterium]|nr:hypothetical protein [Deltaproteobacteria bacterium]
MPFSDFKGGKSPCKDINYIFIAPLAEEMKKELAQREKVFIPNYLKQNYLSLNNRQVIL